MRFRQWLREHDACYEARGWVGGRPLGQAWAECPRGDWLMWLVVEAGVDARVWTPVVCRCARVVEALMCRDSVEVLGIAESWARGEDCSCDDLLEAIRRARDATEDRVGAEYYATQAAYWTGLVARVVFTLPDRVDPVDAANVLDRVAAAWEVADEEEWTGDGSPLDQADMVRSMIPLELVKEGVEA